MSDNDDVAMQPRCTECLAEHYALTVIDISYGDIPCPRCGHLSHRMTRDEYVEALSAAREKREPHSLWVRPPRQRQAPQ